MSSLDASGAIKDTQACSSMISGQSALHHHEGQQRVASVAQCCSLLSGHFHSDFPKPTASGFTLDDTFVFPAFTKPQLF